MSERRAAWVAIGSLLFFALAPGTVAGLIPFWLTGWRVEGPFSGASIFRVAGALIVFAGLGSLVECFARFVLVGLGTPAPIAPPTRLVASGQYRYVRNPMYLAILGIVVGQGLVLGRVVVLQYAALLWLLFHAWVVLYEEPTLSAQFGASYQEYRHHVRRWWPRLRP